MVTTPPTGLIGSVLFRVDRTGSTNDLMRELSTRGAREGTVVVAREQTAGRGRLGRRWVSPPGGLWFSVLLRPPDPTDTRVGLALSVAAADAIESVTGLSVGLKWPNDLIVGRRKVGGILLETAPPWLIAGIGINVGLDPSSLPAEVASEATSLAAALGRDVSEDSVLVAILTALDHAYVGIKGGLLEEALARWRRRSVTLGNPVRVLAGASVEEGIAVAIDEEGALVLERRDGTRRRFFAGDVMTERDP